MKKTLIVLSFFLLVILAWGFTETFRLEVTRVDMQGSPLSQVLGGKTLVHLSDLHMSALGYREKKILEALYSLRPDLIVLTGDYIPWRGDVTAALDFLSRIRSGLGTFAVMGDYDYSDSRSSCLFCHRPNTGEPTEAHPVEMLRNRRITLAVNGKTLTIAGLDDVDEGGEGLKALTTDSEQAMIVLCHDPLRFDELDEKGVRLMLAGDTHGGQLFLPPFVWRLLGYQKNARYNKGLFRKGPNTLYVSRGLGTSHLPLRLFCRPEITVFQF